jgi:DNA-binding transcriptional MerR regulator
MVGVCEFIKNSDTEQIRQFKACIDEGLSFKQIEPFIKMNTPPENIRILKSFYKLGCDPNDILRMIIYNADYDKFKDVKYLIQCANTFDIFYEDIVDFNHSFDIDDITRNLNSLICADRNIAEDQSDIVFKLLKYKMPPEQIEYITNTKDMFFYAQMEAIGIGFLRGLSQKEIEEIMKDCEITDNMTGEEIDNVTQLSFEKINDAIKTKFPDASGLDKLYNSDAETNYFDELGIEI